MALGRMYSILMDAHATTTAKDLISITMPADVAGIVHELNVTQQTTTTSENLAIQMHRASGVAGAGTTTTPRPLDIGNTVAFGGTVLTALTTDETEGNIVMRRAWNVLTPFKWVPTPASQIILGGQDIFVARLDIAPGASMTITAEMIVELLG